MTGTQKLPASERASILAKRPKALELGSGDYDEASRPTAIRETASALDTACEDLRRENLYRPRA
jgi:hypothetical protein